LEGVANRVLLTVEKLFSSPSFNKELEELIQLHLKTLYKEGYRDED